MTAYATQHYRRLKGVYYGWWLVAVSGFIMVIATGPLFHAMSVWAVAMERQFGWSRAQLGWALTFTRIEGGIMGPLEGYLTDKAGTRRMVLIGLLITGAGFVFFGRVQNLWMFYVAYIVMALGQGMGSWVPMMTMLNHWFARRRAVAIGWANVGSRFGALLIVPAIAWAINPDQDRLGWSITATCLGIFVMAIAFPVSRVIRNRPQDYGLLPDGDLPAPPSTVGTVQGSATRSRDAAGGDLTASQALRTSAFWLIAFGHGFTSMVILAIMSHLGLLIVDKGYTVETTGLIVAVYTVVAMGFQLVGGYLGDRVPKRLALFVFTSIQAGAVVVLTTANSLSTFFLFAVLFGIGFGGRNPLTVAVRGEYFGRTSFGKILGLSTVPMNLLLLISSPMAGYMRDRLGTYNEAFLILAGLNFFGGVLFLMARRPRLAPAPQPIETETPQATA